MRSKLKLYYNRTKRSKKIKKSNDVEPFGRTNNFPSELREAVFNSQTASSCYYTRQSFIEGGEIEGAEPTTIIDKQGGTLGELINKLSADLALYEGAYIVVRYGVNLQISSVEHIDYERTRANLVDDSGVISGYSYFPQEVGILGDEIYFPIFNPDPEAVSAQFATYGTNFYGQILPLKQYTPSSLYYSFPSYSSCIPDMEIDKKVSEFHKNNLENNFFSSYLLKMIGDENEPITNEEGEIISTRGKELGKELGREFSGSENGGKVMVFWGESAEMMPSIEAIPTGGNDKLFDLIQNTVTDKIVIAMNVPPLLANIKTSGQLGSSGELENSVKVMQGKVRKFQRMIQTALKKVYPETNITLTAFTYD
jgi:hypothetical protein